MASVSSKAALIDGIKHSSCNDELDNLAKSATAMPALRKKPTASVHLQNLQVKRAQREKLWVRLLQECIKNVTYSKGKD